MELKYDLDNIFFQTQRGVIFMPKIKEDKQMSQREVMWKRNIISVAKQLCYKQDVINALRAAESKAEAERIMITARKAL